MAVFSSNSISRWILSLRFLLASASVLSVVALLKFSAPVMADFVVSEIPAIYSFVLSWLRPPYLYILVNCIIISIVFSSKLQHKVESSQAPLQVLDNPPPPLTNDLVEDLSVEYRGIPLSVNSQPPGPSQLIGYRDLPPLEFDPYRIMSTEEINVGEAADSNKKVNVMKSGRVPERNASLAFSFVNLNEQGKMEEKSRVSARIPSRKSVKSSSEASKPLGVSKTKPKRHDTLESTWKTITDGRAMPLTRHLKKADTWDTRHRQNDENTPPPPPRMKKSETFNDRSSSDNNNNNKPLSSSPSYMKLRREPSLSQDELNRRVEAFIKKFNEDMRLQRQESLNQYQEMINGRSS